MVYSGFWKRFAAYMIDAFILFIPSLAMTQISFHWTFNTATGFILGFLYRPVFESSSLQGTPGKALMGLAVVTENGESLNFKQACLRFFSSYLSAMILMIGYLIQPFSAKRQTLHDLISGSVVIEKSSSPDLNYFSIWKEKFQEIIAKL